MTYVKRIDEKKLKEFMTNNTILNPKWEMDIYFRIAQQSLKEGKKGIHIPTGEKVYFEFVPDTIIEEKLAWTKRRGSQDSRLDNGEGRVYISYVEKPTLNYEGVPADNMPPETCIVFPCFLGTGKYLIYEGDWRNELEELYPDISKLDDHWKLHGNHKASQP